MHVGSSSLTRDRTQAVCIGSMESYPLHHQGSPLSVFLILAHLMSVLRYLTVVLICISLLITDCEHLFMCLLAVFFCKVSVQIFFLYLLLVCFLTINCNRYLYILDTNPLSGIGIMNIFKEPVLFILMKSHLSCFSLTIHALL